MSVHGPWQIAATGLRASKNARTNSTARGRMQLVRIDDAARQQQRVVVLGPRLVERLVDADLVPPLGVIPAANLAFRRRNDPRLGARVFQRLARLGQLDLLEPIGHQDRDSLALENLHGYTPGKMVNTRIEGARSEPRECVARLVTY